MTYNSEYNQTLYSVLLECLSTRSANVLRNNQVGDIHSFLGLSEEELAQFWGAGSNTLRELLDFQQRVRSILAKRDANDSIPPYLLKSQLLSWRPKRNSTSIRFPTPVVARVDDPASWSVLNSTISDLLYLDEDSISRLFASTQHRTLSSMLSLTAGDWDKLSAAALYNNDGLDVLLPLTLDYLVRLGISAQSLAALAGAIATTIGMTIEDVHRGLHSSSSTTPIISEAETAAINNLRIDSFSVPSELMSNPVISRSATWSELAGLSEQELIESSEGFQALPMISLLWQMKYFAAKAAQQASGFLSANITSFELMIKACINTIAKAPRDETILLGRMGLLENRKWTLSELGDMLGLTRERVRQVELKMLKSLRSLNTRMDISKFWLALDETLRIAGGVCTIAEAARQLAIKLEWDEIPHCSALEYVIKLSDLVELDAPSGLVYDRHHQCYRCQSVVRTLKSLFEKDSSERTIRNVTDQLLLSCAASDQCVDFSKSLNLSEGFVQYIATKTKGVLVEDGVVFCQSTWSSKRGSRVQLVESIIKDAGRPMHLSEVYPVIKQLHPDDNKVTEHNVQSWLHRSDNIVQWDRGTFVHCSNVAFPANLIADVESWLKEELEEDIPFVSVAGVFKVFKSLCIDAGIPSETALYSSLRKSANPDLCYPRYPQIYLSEKYSLRVPALVAIEQYIKDAGTVVPYKTLRDYALGSLHLKEFQFQQCIYQSPNIIRSDGGFLCNKTSNIKQRSELTEDYTSLFLPIALAPAQAKMITDTLAVHFPNGFRINSSIELSRFRRFVSEDYGNEISATDEELMHSIASRGMLSDGKVFVISSDIISKIKNKIDSAFSEGTEVIFYNSFYEQNENWLFEGSVVSEDVLKCLLTKLYPNYNHRMNYFTQKAISGSEPLIIKQELLRVWGDDILLNYQEITERLQYIPLDKIKSVMAQNSEFIWNAREEYTHIDKVDVTAQEYADIADYVAEACKTTGYCSLSGIPLDDIKERNYQLTITAIHTAVFDLVLAYLYERRDKIVTPKGQSIDAFALMKAHWRTVDRCVLEDLYALEQDITGKRRFQTAMEACYSVMVRIDKDTFVSDDKVHFDVDAIDNIIDLFVTDNYLPLKSFTTFAAFPHCGYAWNLFVLESYCRRFSKRFRFDVLSVNSRNIGTVIRNRCGMTYHDIMTDAVVKSDVTLNREKVLEMLYNSGYLGKQSYAGVDAIIERARVLRERNL